MINKISTGLVLTLCCSQHIFATEGGIGRPITGMQVQPLNGLLPTTEGGVLTLSSIYYNGEFARSKEVPIIGELRGGLITTFPIIY